MKINMIVAMDTNYLIGQDNGLPWKLPKDLKHFKTLTTGNVVIMGRNTFESIGRPLPNRTNIVITTDSTYHHEGIVVVHSMEQAFNEAEKEPNAEVFIAGGANLYMQMLPMADRLYITEVNGQFEGDAWFPKLNMAHWDITEEVQMPADGSNTHDCTFYTLDRNTTSLSPQ